MNKESPTFCPLMRHQLTINQMGKVMPCCHFGEHIPIDKYEEVTAQYAARLEQGEKIPQCQGCWKTEERGLVSVRQSAVDNYERNYAVNPGINSMDIRLHNKCNMACNMCASYNSTLWAKIEGKDETHEIGITNLQYIYSLAENVTKLSIQGGESFYGPDFVNFVDNFPNKENLILDVFTNVVTMDIKVIERWHNECKKLLINASIDGTESVFEEIRWPGKWSKAERKAIQAYNIIGSDFRHFFAIQSANLKSIVDFLNWRNAATPNSEIIFNLVEGPKELSIDASTQEERDFFINAFDQYDGKLSDREHHDLIAVYKLCKQLDDDTDLINQRLHKNNYVDVIRINYLNKNKVDI
jgi:uncharacterized Fe-S cluster-containing radical SAM superfamily protein